ncbi:MAG: hypothetical protein RIE58_04740 [Vicingaceae bacterium]
MKTNKPEYSNKLIRFLIVLGILLLVAASTYAQGLRSICQGECIYWSHETQLYYPDEENVQWMGEHFELALYPTGDFLILWDLTSTYDHIDLMMNFTFITYDGIVLHNQDSVRFEFNQGADKQIKVAFSGVLPQNLVEGISTFRMNVTDSQIITEPRAVDRGLSYWQFAVQEVIIKARGLAVDEMN